jgi:hypothetical protein
VPPTAPATTPFNAQASIGNMFDSAKSTSAAGAAPISTATGVLTTAAAKEEPLKAPPDYKESSLAKLLKGWGDDLDKNIHEFNEQADRISTWDLQLKDNQKLLEELVDNVHMLLHNQVLTLELVYT